jgi:hypothetical protein
LTDINDKSLKDIAKRVRNRKINFKGENLRIEEKYITDIERCGIPKTTIESAKIK